MDEPSQTPDLRSAAVEGLRWTAISRPLIEVVFFASVVVLARLIGPAEFGRFAIAMITIEFAVIIVTVGVGTALVQRSVVTREHLRTGTALALIAGVALTGVAYVSARVVVEPLFDARTADLVRLSSPMFLISAASTVPIALLRRRLAFRMLSLIDLASSLARSAASVGLAVAGLDGEALVLGGLIAGVVALCIAWASAPAPPPRLRRQEARDILDLGFPMALASLSWVGFRNCDYVLVGARLGPLQAGFYFRAYTLAVEYQKKLSVVVGQLGFPMMARTESDAARARLRTQIVQMVTMVLFPMLALLAVVAPLLVPLVFGSAWTTAVVPTQILVLGGAATLVIDVAAAEITAVGRGRALLGYGVAHFAVYALAVFLVAPSGLAAVAVAGSVVHAAFLVVVYVVMLRAPGDAPIRSLWADIAPATIPCLALLAVAAPLSGLLSAAGTPDLLHMAAVSCVGLATYVVVLRILYRAAWRQLWDLGAAVVPLRRLRASGRRPEAPAQDRAEPGGLKEVADERSYVVKTT